MKNPEIFTQEFFDVLGKYQKSPGQYVQVEKEQLPQPSTILDMRLYIDTSFQKMLIRKGYQYVDKRSSMDVICLLDLTYQIKEYQNVIEKIGYIYDPEKDEIVERVVYSKSIGE